MKPRLIAANELIKNLCETFCGETPCSIPCETIDAIGRCPTAYNIDKVVEQLEELQNFEIRTGQGYCPDANEEECRYRYSDLGCSYCALEKAIEIVKGGGR